jgi:hypothetical protein
MSAKNEPKQPTAEELAAAIDAAKKEAADKAEAERVASEKEAAAKADEGLVTVFKDGTSLKVHESCVKSHLDAGWKLPQ